MLRHPRVHYVGDASAGALHDERFAPAHVIVVWGLPAIPLYDRIFELSRRMIEKERVLNRRYSLITDLSGAPRPSPKAREYMRGCVNSLPPYEDLLRSNYLVTSDLLVRGAISAMKLFFNRPLDPVPVPTLTVAVERVCSDFKAEGVMLSPEFSPSRYSLPPPAR